MTEQGELLPGVTIIVKENPRQGVASDAEGHFKLGNLQPGCTVVFSFIGYQIQELKITGNRERLRIVLKEIVSEMEEAVVVGRGVQRKITLTGAVSTINAEDLQLPAVSVSNMLAGRVPGIISVTRSGEPGSDFSEFWIRGISTFGAGQSALILIDGIDGDLNTLDPADIESFTVLKDASSTAVYGVRGANGVVLVTTKRGKAGKLSINWKSNVSLSHSARMPRYVNAGTYAALANEAALARDMEPIYTPEDIYLFTSGLDPDLYPDINWREVILKDFTTYHQHHLSVSGGGTNARYYLSLGLQNKSALFKQDPSANKYDPNVNYNKYNFRANIDANLTPSTLLSLSLETVLATQISPGYGDDNSALWGAQANLTPVTVPVVYSDGSLPAYGGNSDERNPYVLLNFTGYKKYYGNSNNIILKVNQNLDRLTRGLEAEALLSLNANSSMNQNRLKSPDLYYANRRLRNGALDLSRTVSYTDPVFNHTSTVDRRINFEVHVNYQQAFNDAHRVTGLIHYYMDDTRSSTATTDMESIPKRYIGLSGRATYSYNDTYLLEGNIGYTGSEAFENGKKFGIFPAVSVGWVPTQHAWTRENLPFLSFFKIRASVGSVGNDRISGARFPYLTTMTSSSGSNLWGSHAGVTEEQVGSDNLRWEKSIKYDVGLDIHLFNSSVDMTVDIFRDIRSGIYQQRASIPEEMGLMTIPWANVGEMKSWGMDGHLSYAHNIGSGRLTARANMTYARNEIITFEESGIRFPYQSAVGKPYEVARGLIALGLFKDEDDIAASPRQVYREVMPGDIKYKDVNGDGTVSDDDIVPLSYSSVPRVQYGFALEYTWKNWGFSVFFEGVSKVNYFLGGSTGYYPFAWGRTGNVLDIVAEQENRWTPASVSGSVETENPNARFPRLTYGNNANNNRNSTFWLADASYLRLKNLQVSYELKHPLIQRAGLQGVSISAVGDNLHCWDKVKLWDPGQASSNGAAYPLQRIYTLQVMLKF
jgi:TonB-linked SusC/RagA family outer membrane protein